MPNVVDQEEQVLTTLEIYECHNAVMGCNSLCDAKQPSSTIWDDTTIRNSMSHLAVGPSSVCVCCGESEEVGPSSPS